MLPYWAFSAGMLFSFLRAVCPQKRRHNHGSTVREAQREETHDQCAQDCSEAHDGHEKNLQVCLRARSEFCPPHAILLFHGALERLFPIKRETGSALFTDRTRALLVPAFRAAMDQDLVTAGAK